MRGRAAAREQDGERGGAGAQGTGGGLRTCVREARVVAFDVGIQ